MLADGVRKNFLNAFFPFGGRPNRNRLPVAQIAKTPQVVHAENVVGMPMREEKIIDGGNVKTQTREAKFGSCVDLDMLAVADNVRTRTVPPIFWFGQIEPLVRVRDQRNAQRCSRA